MKRKRYLPKVEKQVRTCCPDCFVMHSVPEWCVGMSLWNLCPKCSAVEDAKVRAVLESR